MKKAKLGDLLFDCAFILLFLCSFYNTTTFSALLNISNIQNIFRLFAGSLIILKCLYSDRYNIRSMVFLILALIFGVIAYYYSHRGEFLDALLLISGASRINFRRMVKEYFIAGLLFLLITFVCSISNIIIDYTVIRFTTGEIRHSFGIVYPTDFAAHVLFLYITYYYLVYKKRKINVFDLIVTIGLVYFLDRYCSARLSELFLIISFLMFFMLNHSKNKAKHRILKLTTIFSFPASAVFSILMTIMYNPSNSSWIFIDDVLFSNRLRVGKKVIDSYGFSLFGQNIPMQGMGFKLNGYDETIGTTYLDSSYLQIFMLYGLIIGFFVVLLFMIYAKKAVKDNDYMMCCIVIIIAISSIINQYLINIAYNPFAIIAGSYVFETLRYYSKVGKREKKYFKSQLPKYKMSH